MTNISEKLESKTLLIAVVENGDNILMRKKPGGSLPYKETWYLFGCERKSNQDDEKTLIEYLKEVIGVDVYSPVNVGEDSEVKQDHDGIVKNFTYRDFSCHYKQLQYCLQYI
mgnify:CR=1 FL=1